MTTTRTFKTNLRCGSCVAAIQPYLDAEPRISRWEVDLGDPDKPLTVHGDAPAEAVRAAIAQGGYDILGEHKAEPTEQTSIAETPTAHASTADEPRSTYYPLALLAGFLIGIVALTEVRAGGFDWGRAMGNFMGAFFIAFSFFKLLDLRGFADSYRGYDVVARRFPGYGLIYPFIELALGVAYIASFQPLVTNIVTLVVMSVSSIGVLQSVLKKRAIRCACLGTVFNLPMSTVTLVEDGLMVAMAAAAIAFGGH
jgi:hypothetical protein